MKKITKFILLSFFILFSLTSISQSVDVQIQDMVVYHNDPNNTDVSSCETIDLKSNYSLRITFTVKMTKSSHPGLDMGTLKIYSKNPNSNAKELAKDNIFPSDWPTVTKNFDFILQESDYCTSGNKFYAAYVVNPSEIYKSCEFPVIKNDNPLFVLKKNNFSIPCGSTSTYNFEVVNVNCSSGSLSYEWNVGNGWKQDDTTVSGTITTYTNSISLVPNTYPLSDISVTPIFKDNPQTTRTCKVNLVTFNPKAIISGNISVCVSSTPEVYSIANLPNDVTVTWSSSITTIATVNSTTGSSTTINALSNGGFNLIARVTDSCGQFKDFSKWISVGNPEITGLMHIPTFGCTMGEINVESNGNVEQFEWQVSGGEIVNPNSGTSYIGGETIFVDPFDSAYDLRVKVRAINGCGYSSWYTKYIPISCDPNGGGETPLKINPETDISNPTINVYPNPVDTELTILNEENNIKNIKLYNSKGRLVLLKSNPLNIEVLDLSKIPNGIYSLLLLGKDKTTKKIIIQH